MEIRLPDHCPIVLECGALKEQGHPRSSACCSGSEHLVLACHGQRFAKGAQLHNDKCSVLHGYQHDPATHNQLRTRSAKQYTSAHQRLVCSIAVCTRSNGSTLLCTSNGTLHQRSAQPHVRKTMHPNEQLPPPQTRAITYKQIIVPHVCHRSSFV